MGAFAPAALRGKDVVAAGWQSQPAATTSLPRRLAQRAESVEMILREDFTMADLNNPKVQKLLHLKTFAHLATLGAKGEPQSSPMWFLWDGEYIKFTHATD